MPPDDLDHEKSSKILQLVESGVDDLDSRVVLNDRERVLAHEVAALVVHGMGAILRDRPANLRLAELETWREDLDAWKARLTGVADSNGRIGTLERQIDTNRADVASALELIRIDVGPSEERAAEREAAKLVTSFVNGIKTRMRWSLLVSMLAIGGSGWGWISARSDARSAAAAAAARIDAKLQQHDLDIERLFDRRATRPAATPDPVRTP